MSLRQTIKNAVDSTTAAVDDSNKKYKKEVNYSVGMKKSHCGICKFFMPEKPGYGDGTCQKVKGRINKEFWCELYQPKSKI